MTKRIAILDENNRLTGASVVADEVDGIDPGDLPTDGTYKYDAQKQAFIPVGFGFGKVTKGVPPYSVEYILAEIIDALPEEQRSGPMIEWLTWFNADLRRRELDRTRKAV